MRNNYKKGMNCIFVRSLTEIKKAICTFIMTGMIGFASLGADEIPADNAVERTAEMFGSIDPVILNGDKRSTQITTNWELDLKNNDGDQNQMSMVKCGNYIYVGISYQSSPLNGKLVVRRYDALTGHHTADDDFLVMGLPSATESETGYHTMTTCWCV